LRAWDCRAGGVGDDANDPAKGLLGLKRGDENEKGGEQQAEGTQKSTDKAHGKAS
jgi:hypothetical protein